jgi:hypothetical protein
MLKRMIDMGWKAFDIKGKFRSIKERFRVIRLTSGLKEQDCPISTVALREPLDLVTVGSLEMELTKAQALLHWQRWENRPK